MPKEMESVSAKFDLAEWSGGSQHANVGQHAATRSDDHDRLLGRVKTVLVEILVRLEHGAWAEEDFNVLVRQVRVTGRMLTRKFGFPSTHPGGDIRLPLGAATAAGDGAPPEDCRIAWRTSCSIWLRSIVADIEGGASGEIE